MALTILAGLLLVSGAASAVLASLYIASIHGPQQQLLALCGTARAKRLRAPARLHARPLQLAGLLGIYGAFFGPGLDPRRRQEMQHIVRWATAALEAAAMWRRRWWLTKRGRRLYSDVVTVAMMLPLGSMDAGCMLAAAQDAALVQVGGLSTGSMHHAAPLACAAACGACNALMQGVSCSKDGGAAP